MLTELERYSSTNGRYGLVVVGEEGLCLPLEGTVASIGTVGGFDTFKVTPANTQQWVVTFNGVVKIHGGASLVKHVELQSSRSVALLLCGKEAVLEVFGYKERSSRIIALINGEQQDVPGTVLAAMGLVWADKRTVVQITPPAPLEGAMAAALKQHRW